jgi:hypothetical protein
MKYIITENKLNNIILKYLDTKLDGFETRKGEYVDIVFVFPDEEYGMLGWKKSGDLYVFYKLRDEISDYFGLEKDDSLRVIGKWVEDRHNLKVINTSCFKIIATVKVEDRHNLKVINTPFESRWINP